MSDANAIMVPAPEVPAAPAVAAPASTAAPAAPATSAASAATPAVPAAAPAQDPPVSFDPPAVPAAPTPPQEATVVYEKTGDAGLDVALRYVGERGFGPDHPAIQAATKGDFSALETALAGLGDKAKGFKEYVDLAKDSYGRRQAAAKTQGEAAAKVIYDAVGGKEQWSAIHAWVGENADADEKAQINAAFKAGGVAAAATAQHLAQLFAKHGKTAPKAAVKADAAATTAPAAGPLNPREYGRAVAALNAKLGSKMEASPEYAQLRARLAASRAR